MEIIDGIYEGIKHLSMLEALGVVFGLLSVWFAKRESIWVFPTGIISVLIYVYLCFQIRRFRSRDGRGCVVFCPKF